MQPLLEVQDLVVKFRLRFGDLTALNGINFSLYPGQRMGLVGESGAGKSVAGFSIINLISKPGFIAEGRVLFQGQEISTYPLEKMRTIRGHHINMIFQDPMMTLNPVLTIGTQMVETIQAHSTMSKAQARAIALEKLTKVHISSPEQRLQQYPHELSGGMRQRVVIAIALLTNPSLIIADEPTTALDVTIQAEVMALLLELCQKEHMGLILITHDLGVVSQVTEKIAVMYAGQIVEQGPTQAIVTTPKHPYTQGLIKALPHGGRPEQRLYQIPGMMPNLTNIPPGCAFHPRCDQVMDICRHQSPALCSLDPDPGQVACHLYTPLRHNHD